MSDRSDQRTIETMLLEERRYPPPAGVRRAGERKAGDLRRVTSRSSGRREGRERISWFEPFTKLYEWEPPYAKWYLGGKLNVSYNCVDRHVEAGKRRQGRLLLGRRAGRRPAEITYADLQREVVRSRTR